jgi:TRAP-type C4-dicarboxylate transport system substrate-binding protein
MNRTIARLIAVAFALLPLGAHTEPAMLKLAFFTSDRSVSYRATVQPFIEAVNAEGKGVVQIVLYSGGVLGRDISKQPDVVRDGPADIALIVPGYTPDLFPDTSVVELPGLFRNTREGTLVYTRLIAANTLKGYDDFVVLGAYVTEPETIHSRLPIASIEDLKGKRIRVNNAREAAALQVMGAVPVPLPVTEIANAISGGTLDGTLVNKTPLSDYGIKRVATHHFLLGTSGAPLALVMNRKTFEALPAAARAILRKYSGEWAAARFIEAYDRSDADVLRLLKVDPKRTIVVPSLADLDRAQHAFSEVIADWLEKDTAHWRLLRLAEDDLYRQRTAQ